MMDLKAKPFYLSDEDIEWIERTISNMTFEEKIGQLFCVVTYDNNRDKLDTLIKQFKPGGLMCRSMSMQGVIDTVTYIQTNSKIPMLVAANLESGGTGVVHEGVKMGSPMQIAATDDESMAYKLGVLSAIEGTAVGVNWTFAPIIDIDMNFRNPITNTRTFGSDVDRVTRMGIQQIKGLQENGMAATIKHFPGDGVDERDQHLVTTVNDLTCEEWDNTFGQVYKKCIDAGAMAVMVGHIMQPAYTKKYNKSIEDKQILPASLSYELVTKLLKDQLGFNGLVVTDSTAMAGIVIPMSRKEAVLKAIAGGCDMFLFARSMEEDFMYMKDGIEKGIISQERLNEALTKILALKAAQKLHQRKLDGRLVPDISEARKIIGREEHKRWAKECADKAITLIKEEEGVLPISPGRYKKVLLYGLESSAGFEYSVKTGTINKFKSLLKAKGFDVEEYDVHQGVEGRLVSYKDMVNKYDLIIYVANIATRSNQTVVRLEWAMPMGINVPVFMESIPTIFISVENPYHLLDVPRIRTFINAYSSTDEVLESLVQKICGKSRFEGISPVDAFCGMWDTHL